jgi:ATP-dependent Clp protease ATP-binding subunit ClpB
VIAGSNKIEAHHRIKVSEEAIDTAIKMTQKFTSNHPSLSRCQPERTINLINLIDMAMATYRNDCHETIVPDVRNKLKSLFTERKKAQDYRAETQALLDDELARLKEEADGKRAKMSERENELKANIRKAETISQNLSSQYDMFTTEINAPFILKPDYVLREFSEKSNIPMDKLNQDERAKILSLPARLRGHIFDQDHVVDALCDSIISASAGLKSDTKPIASYLFAGSSGVGKTEIVKALSIELQGSTNAMVRVDCSEFQEKHSIAKLIGAPPGYEGFSEEAGFLTTAVRRNPHSIILFDEIEKAHPNIFDLLLQVLDDARLTSSYGITAHFNETIVLLTTNIGQEHFLNFNLTHEEAEKALVRDLEKSFRPEFLNRLDGDMIVTYDMDNRKIVVQ